MNNKFLMAVCPAIFVSFSTVVSARPASISLQDANASLIYEIVLRVDGTDKCPSTGVKIANVTENAGETKWYVQFDGHSASLIAIEVQSGQQLIDTLKVSKT